MSILVSRPGACGFRLRDQPEIVRPAVGGDEHIGVEAWSLRLQNDQRGGLRTFSVNRRGYIPSHCVANVWLAHDLFAGLHLDDANAQGRANHCGHAWAVGVKDAAIRTGSGRVSLRAPLLAGGHGRRSGRRQWYIGAWFEVLGYGCRRLAEARYHWLDCSRAWTPAAMSCRFGGV